MCELGFFEDYYLLDSLHIPCLDSYCSATLEKKHHHGHMKYNIFRIQSVHLSGNKQSGDERTIRSHRHFIKGFLVVGIARTTTWLSKKNHTS